MSHLQDIQDIIIPTMVKRKAFGDQMEFVSYEFDPSKQIEDLKMSDIIFLTLNLRKDNLTVKRKIVIKFQPRAIEIRNFAHTDEQFHNEIYSYEVILPFVNRYNMCAMFPKFYSGVSNLGMKDYIVIEDVSGRGFKMSEEILFLDLDHVKLALEQVGRFHAMSYAAKTENPEKFFNVVDKIKEIHWLKDKESTFYHTFKNGFERAVTNLSKKYTEQAQKFLKQLEMKSKFFLEITKPEEPMSVICHGDFCRNNVMYRYCDQGKPIDVKLIDLATVRYASPVIDISLFLFLNLSSEMRSVHLDELLKVYHDSLSSTFPEIKVPTLSDIKEEFKRKSVYGLLHCLYFLPVMSAAITGESVFDFGNFCKIPSADDRGKMIAKVGGRKGTQLMSQLLEECLEKRYL